MPTSHSMKILVCYHKKDVLFKDEILTPIHVGRDIYLKTHGTDDPDYEWLMNNCIGDNTGDNISIKNQSYNELTAIYWAWKNYSSIGNPDYIGLIHYRRHFIFDKNREPVMIPKIPDNYYDFLNYDKKVIEELLDKYDFVFHEGRTGSSVEEQYADNHKIEDLILAMSIALDKNPEYSGLVKHYLKGDYTSYNNMFIMPKELFFRYCEWLFDILDVFEQQVDLSDKRLFISERLTGLFINILRKEGRPGLSLPISTIHGPTTIPIVSIWNNNSDIMTMICSHKDNTCYGHKYKFFIIGDIPKESRDKIETLTGGNITVQFVNYPTEMTSEELSFCQKYNPIYLSQLCLPTINKCIIIDNTNTLASKGNIGDAFIFSNVDDYLISGIKAGVEGTTNVINSNLMVVNLKRLRKHNYKSGFDKNSQYLSKSDFVNDYYRGEMSFIPTGSYVQMSNLITMGLFGSEVDRCLQSAYVVSNVNDVSFVDVLRYYIAQKYPSYNINYTKEIQSINATEVISKIETGAIGNYKRHYYRELRRLLKTKGFTETTKIIVKKIKTLFK